MTQRENGARPGTFNDFLNSSSSVGSSRAYLRAREQTDLRDYVETAGGAYKEGMTKAEADKVVAKANQAKVTRNETSGTSGASGAGSTNTVNITIGGVTTPVNVASSTDASNLRSVLTQLANAQGRSI